MKDFYEENFRKIADKYDHMLLIVLQLTKLFLLDDRPCLPHDKRQVIPFEKTKAFVYQISEKSKSLQQEQQLYQGNLQLEMSEAGFQICFTMTLLFTAMEEKMKDLVYYRPLDTFKLNCYWMQDATYFDKLQKDSERLGGTLAHL